MRETWLAGHNGTSVIDPQARAFLREGTSYTDRARLEEARVALEIARQRSSVEGDADCFADATLALARVHNGRYENAHVLGLTDELLSGSAYLDSTRFMLAAERRSFALTDIGRAHDALDLLNAAAKRARTFAVQDLLEFLEARVYAETRLGKLSPAVYNSNLATAFEGSSDYRQVFHHNAAMAFGEAGLLHEALSHSDQALATITTSSRRPWVAHLNASRAWLLLHGGRLEEARAHLDIAMQERTLTPVTLGRRGAAAAMLAYLTKDKELEAVGDDAVRWVTSGAAEGYRLGPMAVGCHALFIARGLTSEARSLRTRVLSDLRCVFGTWWFLYEVVVHGDKDEREHAMTLLSASNDEQPMANGFRLLANALESGRAGRLHESIGSAREAETVFADSGLMLHAAAAMRLSGRSRHADATLKRCQTRLRIRDFARYDRLKGDRRLTKRQNEVAQMVAAGLRNGEIAGRLGLRLHTVEHHVAAIRQRVGAASRRTFGGALVLNNP